MNRARIKYILKRIYHFELLRHLNRSQNSIYMFICFQIFIISKLFFISQNGYISRSGAWTSNPWSLQPFACLICFVLKQANESNRWVKMTFACTSAVCYISSHDHACCCFIILSKVWRILTSILGPVFMLGRLLSPSASRWDTIRR